MNPPKTAADRALAFCAQAVGAVLVVPLFAAAFVCWIVDELWTAVEKAVRS